MTSPRSLLLLALLSCNSLFAAPSSEPLAARTEAQDNAFTADHAPRVLVKLDAAAPRPAFVRVERFDWLTEQTSTDWLAVPADTAPGAELAYTPAALPYGIHRFTFTPADSRTLAADESASTDDPAKGLNVAHAPAYRAADLPDHWPIGMHANGTAPLVPGFKWYRLFMHWAVTQPAPDRFNWAALDKRFAEIKAVGGRLLLVSDGNPEWTTTKPDKNGAIRGSQYFPDNADDLRNYLRALLARYDDRSGTLAVIEAWNEPNAEYRWADTPEKLVELHRIFFEETRATEGRVRLAGLTISPGHHLDYVERLYALGLLDYCDMLAGHFYEEIGAVQRDTPINNLPQHVALLRNPMLRHGKALPIWNTESGLYPGARENGRFVSQAELHDRDTAKPAWNQEQPWLVGRGWRKHSERRGAAQAVTSVVALLEEGVTNNFAFHPNWYRKDGTLTLPWVSQMTLGSFLREVDYRHAMPFAIERVGGGPSAAARAVRLGKHDGPNLVVAWAYHSDTKHGRTQHWTPWQEPVPLVFRTASASVEVEDLYRRNKYTVAAVDGHVTVSAGEEPVFIRGLLPPANP